MHEGQTLSDTPDLARREQALKHSLRSVYDAFARYKLPETIDPDPCFPAACDERPLRADTLHRLPADAFERYQFKAITTWGTVDDFKHFLPRMLELVSEASSEDAIQTIEPFAVFGKLGYASWRRWRAEEHSALDAYFDAFWAVLLARPIEPEGSHWQRMPAVIWLREFASAHDDLSCFFTRWERDMSHPTHGLMAAVHLADSVMRLQQELLRKHEDRLNPQIIDWLSLKAVAQKLEAAFFRFADSPFAKLLSDGHHLLSVWQRQRLP